MSLLVFVRLFLSRVENATSRLFLSGILDLDIVEKTHPCYWGFGNAPNGIMDGLTALFCFILMIRKIQNPKIFERVKYDASNTPLQEKNKNKSEFFERGSNTKPRTPPSKKK